MKLDPVDVINEGCLETVMSVLAVAFTIWIGAFISIAAYYLALAGDSMWSRTGVNFTVLMQKAGQATLEMSILTPLLVVVGLVLVPFCSAVMHLISRSEVNDAWSACAASTLTSIFYMQIQLSSGIELHVRMCAWIILSLLVVSLVLGCWFLVGWGKNSQARYLIEIYSENEKRRNEKESSNRIN